MARITIEVDDPEYWQEMPTWDSDRWAQEIIYEVEDGIYDAVLTDFAKALAVRFANIGESTEHLEFTNVNLDNGTYANDYRTDSAVGDASISRWETRDSSVVVRCEGGSTWDGTFVQVDRVNRQTYGGRALNGPHKGQKVKVPIATVRRMELTDASTATIRKDRHAPLDIDSIVSAVEKNDVPGVNFTDKSPPPTNVTPVTQATQASKPSKVKPASPGSAPSHARRPRGVMRG